jgi:pyrroloquinoline quinone biosynthesis protein B
MMKYLIFILLFIGCSAEKLDKQNNEKVTPPINQSIVSLVVLGTAQDGGSPHIGCKKKCCLELWNTPDKTRKVVSLGVIDYQNDNRYIFEATPNFTGQAAVLNEFAGKEYDLMPDGVLITHAHIGHYTGLMFLGREAKGAKNVPVFAMPKMTEFLSNNGPWNQLVELENIELHDLGVSKETILTPNVKVTPLQVPHRDEYSETVGFVISGEKKSALFIPDIDKWEKWNEDIVAWIAKVDYAFLDATFYDAKEINNRDISEIPHPFVIESMELFKDLDKEEKAKIHFIHLNHTNPLWIKESNEYKKVVDAGFKVAEFGQRLDL